MEKSVMIIKQYSLESRRYTRRDGTQDTFNSVGFELSDGIDRFYAESTGELALTLQSPLDPQRCTACRGAWPAASGRTRRARRATRMQSLSTGYRNTAHDGRQQAMAARKRGTASGFETRGQPAARVAMTALGQA